MTSAAQRERRLVAITSELDRHDRERTKIVVRQHRAMRALYEADRKNYPTRVIAGIVGMSFQNVALILKERIQPPKGRAATGRARSWG